LLESLSVIDVVTPLTPPPRINQEALKFSLQGMRELLPFVLASDVLDDPALFLRGRFHTF
jgi:hypothetical protein